MKHYQIQDEISKGQITIDHVPCVIPLLTTGINNKYNKMWLYTLYLSRFALWHEAQNGRNNFPEERF